MKILTSLLTAVALLTSSAAMAEQTGRGAATSTTTANDNGFAWGIGLGALAVIGVVVGVVASSASHDTSYHNH